MSDYRKRPDNDPWEDELDFLVWESIEKEREPQRPSQSRTRPPVPQDDLVDPRYRDPLFPPEPQFDDSPYSDARRSPDYPPVDAPPLTASSNLYDDPYYPPAPPAPAEPRARRGRSRGRSRNTASSGYDLAAESAYAEVPASSRQTQVAGEPARRQSASSRAAAIALPKPSINDGTMVGFVAFSLLSLVLMIATLLAQSGDLPDVFPIHLDASGDPDRFGDPTTLWRIPFGILMALLMSLVIAGFLWKRDRFAARFAVAGTILAQVLAWVALVDFLF